VVFLALGFGVYAVTNSVGQKLTPTTTTQERHVITGTFLLSGTEGGRTSSRTVAAAREPVAMTMSSLASRSPFTGSAGVGSGGMDADIWLPLATLVLGWAGAQVTEMFRDRRTTTRERLARRGRAKLGEARQGCL
jgi:hypothetical protein